MIISHKHKFIFLKTNKTAGTSIEISLSRFCGPDDIISPVSPDDEKTRIKLGYPGAQHYLAARNEYGIKDVLKWMYNRKKKMQFYNHITANEVKERIGDEIWDSYYKFCFERNPWDRMISLYYGKYRSEPRPAISKFIRSKYPLILKRKGYGLYTIDGDIAVDKVCKFENMSEELEEVRKHIGIPEPLELPKAKSGFRKDKRNYREILSEEDKRIIAELFSDEINLFNYQY